MAIEDIFRALEVQADEECRMILEGAKAQAKAIEEEARDESKRIRDRRVEVADVSVRARAQHLLNAARLENRKATAAATGESICSTFRARCRRPRRGRAASISSGSSGPSFCTCTARR